METLPVLYEKPDTSIEKIFSNVATTDGKDRQWHADLLFELNSSLEELRAEDPCSDEIINDAVDLLRKLQTKVEDLGQPLGLVAIQQGEILNEIKRHLQHEGRGKRRISFAKWADAKLKFIGRRKRQNLMKLADNVTIIAGFAGLGVDRMLRLLREIPGRGGKDPVGDFLRDHGIEFPQDGAVLSLEFKARVDDALDTAKKIRRGENSYQKTVVDQFHRHAVKLEVMIDQILKFDLASWVELLKVTSLKTKITDLENSIRGNC